MHVSNRAFFFQSVLKTDKKNKTAGGQLVYYVNYTGQQSFCNIGYVQ